TSAPDVNGVVLNGGSVAIRRGTWSQVVSLQAVPMNKGPRGFGLVAFQKTHTRERNSKGSHTSCIVDRGFRFFYAALSIYKV
ncbi:hypothetical protein ACHAXS_013164, partial [Conticribra weissflogii]